MKATGLGRRAAADISSQVDKILRGLGNPEPPLDLLGVRELLKLDRAYYSAADDSVLLETIARLRVAGLQVLKRPTLIRDAIRTLSLKALYLPDQKRILIDSALPQLKHRWNEAHEIAHDIIPWHGGMILGDSEQTLHPECHAQMEAEANYGAGKLLFLGNSFVDFANALPPTIESVKQLANVFGNTITSTLWRFVEESHAPTPLVALISDHPNRERRRPDFDTTKPFRYRVESATFAEQFGSVPDILLFSLIERYCGPQRSANLGEDEVVLLDDRGYSHVFRFETFHNGYEALTLGVWQGPRVVAIA